MDISQPYFTVLVLIIVLAPLAAAVLVFLLGNSQPRRLDWISILSCLVSLIASCLVVSEVTAHPFHLGPIYIDALSVYFILLVNLVAMIASWYTIQFLDHDARHNPLANRSHFHFFFNLFHFTMLAVPMMGNMVVMWIFVELTTVFSTLLVRYRRTRVALEAAWKFIMITTTGIIFALLGTMFLAVAVQDTSAGAAGVDLMSWAYLAQKGVAIQLDHNFVELSFLFILIGYGTKAGLAPMHTWLPDGHGEAPSPVSALLSGVMLKSALYAILRFYTITNLNLAPVPGQVSFTSAMLIGFGLLSLIFATPFILKENRFKRILAYHSLEHMGIIFFGLGIGTELALLAALLHTLNHAITKALMFLIYGFIQYEYTDRLSGSPALAVQGINITGVLKTMPAAATILGWGGLALVGSPPFNLFMSEFLILWAAISTLTPGGTPPFPPVVLAVAIGIFVLTMTIIFGGLVNHIAHILLGKSPWPAGAREQPELRRYLPFLILMLMIVIFGFWIPTWPIQFPELLQVSTNILQNGVLP